MRLTRVRFSLRTLVAFAGIALGVERLWRRSEHFRTQAALCAYFELKSQEYAKDAETWEGMTIDERREAVRGKLMAAHESGRRKQVYRRLARRPWESLPPDTPDFVNPWGLESLSASEIEAMVAAGFDDTKPDAKGD